MSRPIPDVGTGPGNSSSTESGSESKAPKRSGSDTRERILQVAQHQLTERGIDGITIHGIARQVGVTHPAVLHHFGTRAKLVDEVVRRVLQEFVSEFIQIFTVSEDELSTRDLVSRSYRVLAGGPLGRAYAAVAMSKHGEKMGSRRLLRSLGGAVHEQMRSAGTLRKGVDAEYVAMILLLITSSAIGLAAAGGALVRSAGMDEDEQGTPGVPARFEAWLADLLDADVTGSPAPRQDDTARV
jgi:AcrR family transcriptional regulator